MDNSTEFDVQASITGIMELPLELRYQIITQYILDYGVHYEMHGQSPKPTDGAVAQDCNLKLSSLAQLPEFEQAYRKMFSELFKKQSVPFHFHLIGAAPEKHMDDLFSLDGSDVLGVQIELDVIRDCVIHIDLDQLGSTTDAFSAFVRQTHPDDYELPVFLLNFKDLHSVTINFVTRSPITRPVNLWKEITDYAKWRNEDRTRLNSGWEAFLDMCIPRLERFQVNVNGVSTIDRFRIVKGDWRTGKEIWHKTMVDSVSIEQYDCIWTDPLADYELDSA